MNAARVRKTLDRLAYASLILDICIAIVTTLSFFDVGNPRPLLIPISYLLTIVVILSLVMFILLLLIRANERRAARIADRKVTTPDPDEALNR